MNNATKIRAEKMMYDLNLSNTLQVKNNINKNSIVTYNGMVFKDKLCKQIATSKPKQDMKIYFKFFRTIL